MFMVLLSPVGDGMSIENRDPQSLELRRGDMCKTFSLADPFNSVQVILKSTIIRIRLLLKSPSSPQFSQDLVFSPRVPDLLICIRPYMDSSRGR